jgi:hypothetical protein
MISSSVIRIVFVTSCASYWKVGLRFLARDRPKQNIGAPQLPESLCHLPQLRECRCNDTNVRTCPCHHVSITEFIPPLHFKCNRNHAQGPTRLCHPAKLLQYPHHHLNLLQNLRHHPEMILNHPYGDASCVFSPRALRVLEA